MPKRKAIKPLEPKKKAIKRYKNVVLDKIEDTKMTEKTIEITKKDTNKLTEIEYKKDIEARVNKRKGEIEFIFEMVCKGTPTEDIARRLQYSESYILDMVKRGKEGAVEYWRKMYGA